MTSRIGVKMVNCHVTGQYTKDAYVDMSSDFRPIKKRVNAQNMHTFVHVVQQESISPIVQCRIFMIEGMTLYGGKAVCQSFIRMIINDRLSGDGPTLTG